MKNIIAVVFIIAFCSCSSNNTQQSSANPNNYTAPDDIAIKKAVDDAYAALSFKDGQQPKYDNIKNAFIPQAQLINYITDTAQILSIDDFVKAFKNYVQTTNIQTFDEQEIYGRTDQFGNIAQRISSYKTYINSNDIVKERGVNSFQLIKTPQGWKVSSIIWDVEKSGLSIPDVYLGK
ncbi:MAG: hypothetical protein JO072_11410 [Parafilimonas sp.]|nr:hypothetical protein [Parafilimonas sp.]